MDTSKQDSEVDSTNAGTVETTVGTAYQSAAQEQTVPHVKPNATEKTDPETVSIIADYFFQILIQ
jgi:hypothetical protein